MASTQVFAEGSEKIRVTRHTYRSSFEMGMNRQSQRSTELDRIADSLLKSSALKHDEIDKIVARKDLFSSVKARVAAESANHRQSVFGTTMTFRPRALSFAALAVIALITVISAVEAIVNRTRVTQKAPTNVSRFEGPTPKQQQEQQPEKILSKDLPKDLKGIDSEPPVFKSNRERPATIPTSFRPSRNARPEEQPLEFYALADMNSAEPVAGGRVVRVDLPRASLVSLGVNVPLGNDKQIIKTDLLIGPDGVPRAIRLVE
jgi:hypothetical protein